MKRVLFFILLALLFVPIKVYAKATTIEVRGMAVSAPGEFGKQFFYLANGKNLWQIYSYHSLFPIIKKGDVLIVRGEKAETRGIGRIKTSKKEQLKIVKNELLPETISVNSRTAKENLGKLVLLEGEIKKDEDEKYYLTDKAGKINIISPKSSNTFIKEAKNTAINGVPVMSGGKLSFLLLSEKFEKSATTTQKQTEVTKDLLRPKKEFNLAKISLLIIIILSILALALKIAKKRKLF